ncbi:tRNA1(Val) (adenine(37)-N6)-methyltransferase [Bartonella sp. HY406]|uniref:tRNA1(Val) (adenine(37)-N6)-methyltransferase n=1 Tax=Bartonella sp. HY406 TaxID=2979331 RepID=UPI0021C84810|nr:methyltransferase [Bartonella sp. HY406]UXN04106.1 methyltransferase [Bartonella sp. HY406]
MPLSFDNIDETIDVFHRGRFALVQPRNFGHRSGMDAMMLAALVPTDFSGQLVDLGAGAGAAGLAVASRCDNAKITLVERSRLMAQYAQKTLHLPENIKFKSRTSLLNADVTLRGKARLEAGLIDNSFDFAIMNPPFNEQSDRATPDKEKADAHVMTKGMFDAWLRTAAALLRPGGFIGLIARPTSLEDILPALQGRFGGVVIIPIYPRPHQAAIRILVYAKKGSRAALSFASPILLHNADDNKFSPRTDAICNGILSVWDKYDE